MNTSAQGGGRGRAKKLVGTARALLTDPRHDPAAALALIHDALRKPRRVKLRHAPKRTIASSADGSRLVFDTPTRRRIREVEGAALKAGRAEPARYRLQADGGSFLVFINDDEVPSGKLGWYRGDQRSGKPSAEMPIARQVREAEERHLLEVGRIMHGLVARKKKPATKAAKIAEMLRESSPEGLKPNVRKIAAATKATPRYVRKVAKTVSQCNPECNLKPSGAPLSA